MKMLTILESGTEAFYSTMLSIPSTTSSQTLAATLWLEVWRRRMSRMCGRPVRSTQKHPDSLSTLQNSPAPRRSVQSPSLQQEHHEILLCSFEEFIFIFNPISPTFSPQLQSHFTGTWVRTTFPKITFTETGTPAVPSNDIQVGRQRWRDSEIAPTGATVAV